jgi:acyl-CoA thioester hydrolase
VLDGGYQEMLDAGVDMVVGEVNVRFLGPAGFDDELDFDVRVTRLGETALSTRFDVTTAGRPVVEGRMRHVFIEPDTKQKRPMPDEIREGLLPYLDESAE